EELVGRQQAQLVCASTRRKVATQILRQVGGRGGRDRNRRHQPEREQYQAEALDPSAVLPEQRLQQDAEHRQRAPKEERILATKDGIERGGGDDGGIEIQGEQR